MLTLSPSADTSAAFDRLVASLRMNGQGGDQVSRMVGMRRIDDKDVQYPESASEHVGAVARELYGIEGVRRAHTYEELSKLIRDVAAVAAIGGTADLRRDELRRVYDHVNADPTPLRMLFQVRPRLHIPEDELQVGDVTFFQATATVLDRRWPGLARLDKKVGEHILKDIRERRVSELTIAACPSRAEELAAERLNATFGVLGLEYVKMYRDWPSAGLLPADGVAHITEDVRGTLSFSPATFYERGFMQFPAGYLPVCLAWAGPKRLTDAIGERRSDDMSRRLLVALQWWTSGNEPGPWAMRFSKYMTVFETLFGRAAQRFTPGLTKRLAARTAAIVASDIPARGRIDAHFQKLYDVRSDTIHEGALAVDPVYVFDAMCLGANAISYLARSTFTDDATFHQHLDALVASGDVWIEYGHRNGLDISP